MLIGAENDPWLEVDEWRPVVASGDSICSDPFVAVPSGSTMVQVEIPNTNPISGTAVAIAGAPMPWFASSPSSERAECFVNAATPEETDGELARHAVPIGEGGDSSAPTI